MLHLLTRKAIVGHGTALFAAVSLLTMACGPSTRSDLDGVDAANGDANTSICVAGTSQCNGSDVQQCVGGQWQTSQTCSSTQICDPATITCEDCPEVSFSVLATQACALGLAPGTDVDAEAFINLNGVDHRLMAMDRWGAGHVFAWCDSSSFGDLRLAFDVFSYLGQTQSPRILSFGDLEQCNPNHAPDCSCTTPMPPDANYVGTELPAQYRGNAAQLADDYRWAIDLELCVFLQEGWTTTGTRAGGARKRPEHSVEYLGGGGQGRDASRRIRTP